MSFQLPTESALQAALQLDQALRDLKLHFPKASEHDLLAFARLSGTFGDAALRLQGEGVTVHNSDPEAETDEAFRSPAEASDHLTVKIVFGVIQKHFTKTSSFQAHEVSKILGVQSRRISSCLYALRRNHKINRIGADKNGNNIWEIAKPRK